ncbi:MAG: RDD family protein [Gammaproteobacteria bacterium]|nr:RDD family protein [Gammaproteobacteria bacterium]
MRHQSFRPTPGPARRFAAMGYDAILLIAVLWVAALPLPLLAEATRQMFWPLLAIRVYLLITGFLFFGWFWVHGGQTLGMRAWRVRVTRFDGAALNWSDAGVRFLCAGLSWACGGLGFVWVWFDRDGYAWHDRLSKTRLLIVPKRT